MNYSINNHHTMTIQTLQHAKELESQIQVTRSNIDSLRKFQQQAEHYCQNPITQHPRWDSYGIQHITIHYKDNPYLKELDITPDSDIYALLTTIIADQEQHLQSLQHELSEL